MSQTDRSTSSTGRPAAGALAARPRMAGLAALALGAVSTLTYAPFALWFLAPLISAAMLTLFLWSTPRRAARLGFLFGVGLFLSGTYWIYVSVHIFGRAHPAIAVALMLGLVVIMALYLGLTGWLVSTLAAGRPWRLVLVGPATWTLIEWLRGWLLSGFPWLSLGYAQIESPLAGWAPVIGVYGLSWLTLSSAAALLPLALRLRPARAAVLAVMPWFAGYLLAGEDWTEPRGEELRVTIVQAGIPQDRKWLPEQFRPTLELYRNALLAERDSDLVVWPEVAIPAVDTTVSPYLERLQADLRPAGQSLALGILEADAAGQQVYNSVLLLDGASEQSYRKRHLVPFGEYFPVPDVVRSWMRLMSLPNTDMLAGEDRQPLLVTAGGLPLAAAICYEDAYGAEQLYALPDAALLINVSNDAWFGDSIAPHQHLQVARMRALEAERPMVRATNDGISAFVDYKGRIERLAPQFEYASITETVHARQGSTPYAALGNAPLILLLIVAVFLPAGLERLSRAR